VLLLVGSAHPTYDWERRI